jgi:FKBP-type peptidyl-prolyl cis-trans isomerase 2
MKDKLRKNISLLVIGLFLACTIVAIVEMQFKILQRGYDHFIMDNRNHYLSCQDLPIKVEVERVVEEQRDVIQQIQEVAPGFVGVEIDSLTCEGKADLLIWYGTHQQRVAIEQIIGSDTFFGIPYRLQNR